MIGTLCISRAEGIHCIVTTGDKDMAQLVDDHVTLVNTMSQETLDEAGWPPSSACRRSASSTTPTLVGDTSTTTRRRQSGPKTAVKWLAE